MAYTRDQTKAILDAKKAYELAKKKGDKKGMDFAHTQADKARGNLTSTTVNNQGNYQQTSTLDLKPFVNKNLLKPQPEKTNFGVPSINPQPLTQNQFNPFQSQMPLPQIQPPMTKQAKEQERLGYMKQSMIEKTMNPFDSYSSTDIDQQQNLGGYAAPVQTQKKKGTFLGNVVYEGLTQANSLVFQGLDLLLPTELLGDKDFLKPVIDYYKDADLDQKKKSELHKDTAVKRFLGDAITSTVAMVPDLITTYATRGASKYGQASQMYLSLKAMKETQAKTLVKTIESVTKEFMKNPMFNISFLKISGTSYDQELEKGATEMEATVYALLNGVIGSVIEMSGIQKPVKVGEKALIRWLRNIPEEAGEEILQSSVESLLNLALPGQAEKDEWFSWDPSVDAVINPLAQAREGAIGGFAGAVAGGPMEASTAILNKLDGPKTVTQKKQVLGPNGKMTWVKEKVPVAGTEYIPKQQTAPVEETVVKKGALPQETIDVMEYVLAGTTETSKQLLTNIPEVLQPKVQSLIQDGILEVNAKDELIPVTKNMTKEQIESVPGLSVETSKTETTTEVKVEEVKAKETKPVSKKNQAIISELNLAAKQQPTVVDDVSYEVGTHKHQKQVESIAKAFKTNVLFVEPLSKGADFFQGAFKDGTIIISTKVDNPVHVVMGHEMMHVMETRTPKEYQAFKKIAVANLSKEKMATYLKNYKNMDEALTKDEVVSEILADFSGQMFDDPKVMQRIFEDSPTLAKRIVSIIEDMIKQLKTVLDPFYQVTDGIKDLEKVRDEYIKLMQKGRSPSPQTPTSTSKDSKAKLSVKLKGEKLYHGTGNDFNEFDLSKAGRNYKGFSVYGKGIYLALDKKIAKGWGERSRGEKDIIMEFSHNIENALDLTEKTKDSVEFNKLLPTIEKQPNFDTKKWLDERGYDAIVDSMQVVVFDNSQIKRENISEERFLENEISKLISEVKDHKPTKEQHERFNSLQSRLNELDKLKSKERTRFSLKNPIEETKDLIAAHNLTEDKLASALELGGFAMPSIAIIKKDMLHRFGDITALFNKETIDPWDNDNKVYSAGAWTPTFPQVFHKINEEKADALESKVKKLTDKTKRMIDSYNFYAGLDSDNLKDNADRHNGDLIWAYKDKPLMQLAFVMDTKQPLVVPMRAKTFGRHSSEVYEILDTKITTKDVDAFRSGPTTDYKKFVPIINDVFDEYYKDLGKERSGFMQKVELQYADVDRMLGAYMDWSQHKGEQVVDTNKLEDTLKELTENNTKYNKWLDKNFEGLIEKKGVRNNKDMFTNSGNRRSFESLHESLNLDNIVKQMRSEESTGTGFMAAGPSAIMGASSKQFYTIKEIKENKHMIKDLTEDEITAIREELGEDLSSILEAMTANTRGGSSLDAWQATDRASEAIVQVVKRNPKDAKTIKLLMAKEYQKVTLETAEDILSLMKKTRTIPVQYFEAKPRRAVRFNEVAAMVIPKTTSMKLKKALKEKGVRVVQYDETIDGDRIAKINKIKGIQFSVKMDSEGRTLTEAQAEYFKDSKAVDDNGNLKAFYHGTNTPNFTVFDPKFSDDKKSLFFSDNPGVSDTYTSNQDHGDIVDPYQLPKTIKTVDAYNKYMEEHNKPSRILKVTDELIEKVKVDMDTATKAKKEYVWEGLIPVMEKVKGQSVLYLGGINYAIDEYTRFTTEEELLKQQTDHNYWTAERFGNKYEVYLNLKNPYIVDGESVHSGKGNVSLRGHEMDSSANITLEIGEREFTPKIGYGNNPIDVVREFVDAKTFSKIKEQVKENQDRNIKEEMERYGVSRSEARKDLDSLGMLDFGLEIILTDVDINYKEPGHWASLQYADGEGNTRAVAEWAEKNGHDGVIIKNIKDNGGWASGAKNEKSTIAIAFNSNQIKATSNPTPTESDDIRYSKKNKPTIKTSLKKPPTETKTIEQIAATMETQETPREKATAKLNAKSPKARIAKQGTLAKKMRELGAMEDIHDTIAKTMTGSEKIKPKLGEVAFELSEQVRRKFIDTGTTVARIAKINNDPDLYFFFNNARNSRKRAEFQIGNAQSNINGTIVGKSLRDIFQPIRKNKQTYLDFQDYMFHKHNIDRMSFESKAQSKLDAFLKENPEYKGKSILPSKGMTPSARKYTELMKEVKTAKNKPVYGRSVTSEQSKIISKMLLKENPNFKTWESEIRGYLDNLVEYRIASGLWSVEQADMMAEMYKNYVPTHRYNPSTKGIKTFGSATMITRGLKTATGSDKPLLALHEQIARQTMSTVDAAHKNLFGQRLAENINSKTMKYIQDIEKNKSMYEPETVTEKVLRDSFTVYEDGEAYTMMTDAGLYEAIESLSGKSANDLLSLAARISSTFKQLITSYSPMFLVRNFVRDMQDVGIYSKYPERFPKTYAIAVHQIATNGLLWRQYQALGGAGNSFFDYDKGYRNDPNWLKKNTLDRVESLNLAIEQAPRLAEFIATLEDVGHEPTYEDLMRAMYNSADVTVNFGRSGTWGKTINSTFVPFFNPAIQGASRMVRRFTETRGIGEWTGLIIRIAALGIVPSLFNQLMYEDDDDYEILHDSVKDLNYLIKIGEHEFFKIPKGRVLSLFGSTAQRIDRQMKGDEQDLADWAGLIRTGIEQVGPINPLESNIVSPITLATFGRTWYGGYIEPQRVAGRFPHERYTESTSELSKFLVGKLGKFADAYDISPMKLDYIIDAYTGVIGDFAIPLMTKRAESNPFTKAFIVDSKMQNRISQDFYSALDEIQRTRNSDKGSTFTDDVLNRYMNKTSSKLSDLYAENRHAQMGNMSDQEKKAKVRDIQAEINAVQLEALSNLGEIRTTTEKLRKKYDETDPSALDVLSREVNREVFGAEYALYTYNKSVHEKAETYVDGKDLTWDTYYDAYFVLKDVKSGTYVNTKGTITSVTAGSKWEGTVVNGEEQWSSSMKKYKMINESDLSDAGKKKMYEAFGVSDKVTGIDTGTKNVNMQKYEKVEDYFDKDSFASLLTKTKELGGITQANLKAASLELGFTSEQRHQLYKNLL